MGSNENLKATGHDHSLQEPKGSERAQQGNKGGWSKAATSRGTNLKGPVTPKEDDMVC